MILRDALGHVERRLAQFPAVVLLGARQTGKTTLAHAIARRFARALVLDLELASDRAATSNPELFFPAYRQHLVVLDEVQHAPHLFAALRPEIDADRRPGRFLLLGSASAALLRQSGESLAGHVAYVELPPIQPCEVPADLTDLQRLWLRGGFPLSYLASDDEASLRWRQEFLRTFLQRDLPAMGGRVPGETMRRFWAMLAHLQGQLLNASQLGLSLGGVSHSTVGRYLDMLVDTMMVRRLQPYLANVGKRLVKSPKVYVRDSGLLHALHGLSSVRDLQGHPIAGSSWEGLVVEQVFAAWPPESQIGFYRTAAGAELDLVVEHRGRRTGVEIKFSAAPKPARGFWQALEDLQVDRALVVAPVSRSYPLAEKITVVPVWELKRLAQ